MEALQSYFAMNGYGSYIWPGYLLALVVMVGLLVISLRAAHAREAELAILQRSRPHRGAHHDVSPQE